ncbi:MAG: universal stress protein [Candidatus Hydrothermarchaeaceae archaeon]
MKILLCIGGEVYGEHAAGFVGRLGKGMDIDCTVLYVNPGAKTFRYQKFPLLKTKEEIDEFVERAVDILKTGGVKEVRTVIRDGESTREILEEAEEGYHLVVTGTRGAKGLERHLFESVSYQVAEYAKVPVLVVRKEVMEKEKILLATDGSETSKGAIYCGGYLVKRLGFDVNVLSVTPTPERRVCSEAAVEEAREILKKEFGINSKGWVLTGNPAEKILQESVEMDLVILGSRGMSKIRRLLLGHVSQRVLADEKTNVLIVRNCEFYSRGAE